MLLFIQNDKKITSFIALNEKWELLFEKVTQEYVWSDCLNFCTMLIIA